VLFRRAESSGVGERAFFWEVGRVSTDSLGVWDLQSSFWGWGGCFLLVFSRAGWWRLYGVWVCGGAGGGSELLLFVREVSYSLYDG